MPGNDAGNTCTMLFFWFFSSLDLTLGCVKWVVEGGGCIGLEFKLKPTQLPPSTTILQTQVQRSKDKIDPKGSRFATHLTHLSVTCVLKGVGSGVKGRGTQSMELHACTRKTHALPHQRPSTHVLPAPHPPQQIHNHTLERFIKLSYISRSFQALSPELQELSHQELHNLALPSLH